MVWRCKAEKATVVVASVLNLAGAAFGQTPPSESARTGSGPQEGDKQHIRLTYPVPEVPHSRLGMIAPPRDSHMRHAGQMHDHAPGPRMNGGMRVGGGVMQMPSSVDLLAPMSQEASGTAWLPQSTPMYGKMFMLGPGMRDMLMLHGDIHFRYVNIGSERGDRRIDAPNWFMGMFSHPLSGRSQLGLRAMFSLDPLTEGGNGYPLLFQTGETWHNQPLHDRQHPHDLVSELSATYSQLVNPNVSASLYAGYPGEPALGPPTFMHRLIAFDLADAPLGHHWQDSAHITWGVATAGINFANRAKLEGSWFNGREPDENRYLPDDLRLDSYSGRLSFNPDSRSSLQASYGFVRNPESDGLNLHRITASWVYNIPFGEDANLSAALVWGQNILGDEGATNSYLLEASCQRGPDTVFGRIENITKSGHELVLPEALHARKYNLGAYTIGYVRDLTHGAGIDTGLGAAVTINTKSSGLDAFYGADAPVSFQVFLRIRPSRVSGHSTHAEHAGMGKDMPGHSMAGSGAPNVSLATMPTRPKSGQLTALTVRVTDQDGKPVTGATVTAGVEMRSMEMGVERPAFKDVGEGRYEGSMTFSMPGPWRVNLSVLTPGMKAPLRKSVNLRVER